MTDKQPASNFLPHNDLQPVTRDSFFQAVRGLCIVAVVLIHIPHAEAGSEMFGYWMSFRQVVSFPVAVFVFMAGYFTDPVKVGRRGWMAGRLRRVGVPYVVWTVCAIGLKTAVSGNIPTGWELLRGVVTGGHYHLYYLVVLLQLTLLTPLIVRVVSQRSRLTGLAVWLITAIWIGGRYALEFSGVSIFETDGLATFFLSWLCFYYWGLRVRIGGTGCDGVGCGWTGCDGVGSPTAGNSGARGDAIVNIALLGAALVLSLFESTVLYRATGSVPFAAAQLKVSSMLYAAAFIRLLLSIKDARDAGHDRGVYGAAGGGRWLVALGDYSFGIYLVHVLFLLVISKLTVNIEMPGSWFLPWQVAVAAVTLGGSYYAVRYAGVWLGPRLSKIFGLR